MDDKPTKWGGGAVALVLVALLVLLPMFYVLSVGPAIWLIDSDLLKESWRSAVAKVYWPLDWLANNVPVVGPAITRYAEWWLPAPPQQAIYSAPAMPSAAESPAPALSADDIVPAADALPAPLAPPASP